MRKHCLPLLFRTRSTARAWIEEHYGYIARRPDLRKEPHGWRTPQAVRVIVTISEERGSVRGPSEERG